MKRGTGKSEERNREKWREGRREAKRARDVNLMNRKRNEQKCEKVKYLISKQYSLGTIYIRLNFAHAREKYK